MNKVCIEICIISARGLGRKSSLLKPQWFAVGWIESENKYCTKIDVSGSPNPTWKTKFSISVDLTDTKLERMILTIEVYRREPIFLRERLHGVATVKLEEFIDKHRHEVDKASSGCEETASFQLRKRNSGKPKGFVDVSVRVSNEEPGTTLNSGPIEGITYSDQGGITLAIEDGPVYTYPSKPHTSSQTSPVYKIPKQPTHPYTYPSQPQEEYRPPLQQPPFNAGTTPPPYQAPVHIPGSYINVAPSRPTGTSSGPGIGMGLGAGALAAGAMIFGDDFISGANLPSGFDGASVIAATNPLF
ncbi:Calcium-dependent lipid-binding (CaLB domain) family protein [Rhynchospora pubera]|uniref:Calcium-dependent lipid-binding (CaLB domain) family protein n=1 Tax=Rhynchospora pubera TaxID=906938 RepID=A0AAV8HU82_9POAL|nr:Calcium-dependent lipid-binding (CaLB domain) family protein [Rhynchospora pubera]